MHSSHPFRARARRGFTLLELVIVVLIAGVISTMSVGRMHDIMVQQRVSRAATAVRLDLESAFEIAARNRRPIEISWDASKMQLGVTDRAGTTAYRHTGFGQDAYGLSASNVTFSRTSLEIYPNGLAQDTLLITFQSNAITKSVRMSRAGLVQIQ